jgi:coatomer subunit beta
MIDTTDIIFLFRKYSVFGEDALVNVSVEKKEDNDGKLAGYIRIRSKTQGIALSLGDRITSVQRGLPQKQ